MKTFVYSITMAFLLSFGSVNAADPHPHFVAPVQAQTGGYNQAIFEATGLTGLRFSGATMEVITEGNTLFGLTVPEGSVFLTGFLTSPDAMIAFQSPLPLSPIVEYTQDYEILLVLSHKVDNVPTATLIGTGRLVFDPMNVGSGGTVLLDATFIEPFFYYGKLRTSLEVLLTRTATGGDYEIHACDRSFAMDFSPAPPVTLCNL